jgi:hypothetical protein
MRDGYVDDDDSEVRDGQSVRVRLDMMDSMQRAVFDAYGHQPGYARLTDAQAKLRREARGGMIRRAQNAWRDANPAQFTCPSCKGTGKDVDGDSPDGRCDECEGTGYIRGPNNLSSALREDPGKYPDTDLKVDARSIADARAKARASYDAMVTRISNAWRRDAGDPDAATELLLRRHLKGDPDDDGAPDPGDPMAVMAVMRRHLTERGGEEAQRERDRAWNSYKDQLSQAWQQGRTDPRRAVEVERRLERERGKYA